MKKRALITGATGQDGSYLAEFLMAKGYEVHGMKRRASSYNTQRVDHLYTHDFSEEGLQLHYGDMIDSSSITNIIAEVKPDEIYNLAAQSHVRVSFETPEYTANADALGCLRILESIRSLGLISKTRFYQASTSEMFGLTSDAFLSEETKFYPRSPYAAAKVFAYWITVNYREAYSMYASNGILFNHESPRRGETFVTQKVVKAAVEISRGRLNHVKLGNLNAIRDWGHARDYVRGMWMILQHENPDDFVLATGYSLSVREFTELVFSKLGIEITWAGEGFEEQGLDQNGIPRVQVDPRYFRPTEVPYLRGDFTKARQKLGWEPSISITELIDEMIEQELQGGHNY